MRFGLLAFSFIVTTPALGQGPRGVPFNPSHLRCTGKAESRDYALSFVPGGSRGTLTITNGTSKIAISIRTTKTRRFDSEHFSFVQIEGQAEDGRSPSGDRNFGLISLPWGKPSYSNRPAVSELMSKYPYLMPLALSRKENSDLYMTPYLNDGSARLNCTYAYPLSHYR